MAGEPDGTAAGFVFAKHPECCWTIRCNVSAIVGAVVVLIFFGKISERWRRGREGPAGAF